LSAIYNLCAMCIRTSVSIFADPKKSRPDEECEVCRGGWFCMLLWFEEPLMMATRCQNMQQKNIYP